MVLRCLRGLLLGMQICVLCGADSRVSVYVLFALGAMACLMDNGAHGRRLEGPWKRGVAFVGCGLFGALVCLANYGLFQPLSTSALMDLAVVFLGSGCAVWEILLAMEGRLPVKLSPNSGKWKPWQVFLAAWVSMSAVYLAYLFSVLRPGGVTNDSVSQLTQILTGGYWNHHPYWHTQVIRVFFRLGQAVGGVNGGVMAYCAFQCLFLAGCFAYAVATLYQAGLPVPWVMGPWAAFAFLPYHFVYAGMMWKDIPFAAAVLVFLVALYRWRKAMGRSHWIVAALSCLLACVWRTNGLLAMGAAVAVYGLFWKDLRKKLLPLALAVVCGFVLVRPVLAFLDVAQPDAVESLSVPVQQVARVIAAGRELTEEESALLDRVVDLEAVPELYEWYISDPIKDEIRRKDKDYFEENLARYGKLWLQLGLRYPGDYLEGWIDQTKGYWNGGYDYWVFPIPWTENSLGVAWPGASGPGRVLEKVVWLFEVTPWLQWMTAIGFHVWVTVLALLHCLQKRRWEGFLTVPVLFIIATLWVATPVSCEFRYAYCLFTCLPFLLPVVLGQSE